jgi:hypothetical protein
MFLLSAPFSWLLLVEFSLELFSRLFAQLQPGNFFIKKKQIFLGTPKES